MAKRGNNRQTAIAFADGKQEFESYTGNMFVAGNTIFSYGTHFPLAHRLPCGFIICNGDRYSVTTSSHQSSVRSAIEGDHATLSFTALEAASLSYRRLQIVDYLPDAYGYDYDYDKDEDIKITPADVPMGATPHYRDGEIVSWHRPAMLVITQDNENHWLCGMDEGSYFISRLPVKVANVQEALEVLIPNEVKGREYIRQGEWFFVPVIQGLQAKHVYKAMGRNFVLPKTNPRSNNHTCTRGFIIGFKNYVSGQVYHSEHRTAKLSLAKSPVIFEAFKNTSLEDYSAGGWVD